jgi:hypothetical protein
MRHIAQVSKICAVAPRICGLSVWRVFHVNLLGPRILRWFPDLWKKCTPLV